MVVGRLVFDFARHSVEKTIKEGANLMAEQIKKTGHTDVFVRLLNGLYKVQVGAYTKKENAEATVRDTRRQVLAVRSKISVWAADQEPVRWNSTVRASRVQIRICVWDVAHAVAFVHMEHPLLQMEKRRLITIDVWDVEDVWLFVQRMRLQRILQILFSC